MRVQLFGLDLVSLFSLFMNMENIYCTMGAASIPTGQNTGFAGSCCNSTVGRQPDSKRRMVTAAFWGNSMFCWEILYQVLTHDRSQLIAVTLSACANVCIGRLIDWKGLLAQTKREHMKVKKKKKGEG